MKNKFPMLTLAALAVLVIAGAALATASAETQTTTQTTQTTGAAGTETTQTKTHTYSYDSNANGFIEPEEFSTYFYTRSDLDRDGFMGDEEWKMSTSKWYRPYKDVNYNTYTYWDQDKDGRLDNNEVKTLVEKTNLYSKWDTNTDGKVDNEEFAKETFNAYDDNSDGNLNLEEWKSVLR